MSSDLPDFRKVMRSYAASIVSGALSGPRGSALLELREYEDRHYRVIFSLTYFELREGADVPSKSQWSTLKKKLKRRNRSIFVFREHGQIKCPDGSDAICLYLDFGFRYE